MSNTILNQFRRITLIWGPVLVIMAFIFVASAQPKYPPPGGPEAIYFSGLMPVFPGGWEFVIKKGAHMIIYGLLAVVNMRALLLHGLSLREAFPFAILLAAAYAIADELHQSFIQGRFSSVRDVAFDVLGAVLFSVFARRFARFLTVCEVYVSR
ncbi:MAG: VanZ family protein [Anaerolineae bacterium]|nr:VanZ family protein [Anaerolineae bacterium]